MIITFPFEDDPYYSAAPVPRSYTSSAGASLATPAVVQKYINLAKSSAGGIFPVGENRYWHGGAHLPGTAPIRAVANGTIVAYRLDSDYFESALAKKMASSVRKLSGSFVLIRHEFEANNAYSRLNRYQHAHFYSLYANLMPKKDLEAKTVLPPFLTTTENVVDVQVLRGDLVTVMAINTDAHNMIKVKAKDINSGSEFEGWIEKMNLDAPAVPITVGAKVPLSYPILWLFKCHPSEKQWRTLDAVKTINYKVRVGEVIGYAGKTDSPTGVAPDSFHFEIFTADNKLVVPMKPLDATKIGGAGTSHQEYQDGSIGDAMGKVWLTKDAVLSNKKLSNTATLSAANTVNFTKGSCFIAVFPCSQQGEEPDSSNPIKCFKLIDMKGHTYFSYINQANATADGRTFLSNAWVTLTTDTDWMDRGWGAFKDKELNSNDDGFVEDDDPIMQKILTEAHKTPANLSALDLRTEGVDVVLRKTAVQFHSEWDKTNNDSRYAKLKTGTHPPLPMLSGEEFAAFKQDAEKQQFWTDASIKKDGIDSSMRLLTSNMNVKNWHFHPIGFLAQMRECLTTDVWLPEENFEREIRESWVIGLKLIEKRLLQMTPWATATAVPMPPTPAPLIPKEYMTTQTISNVKHTDLWSNFEYWFGVTPNTAIAPLSSGSLTSKPAGHHVYNYLVGLKAFFKHVSMQRIMKGALGFSAGAYVIPTYYPTVPLIPAKSGFKMEYIHIANQFGSDFAAYNPTAPVEQNRMEVQLHEIAHLQNTAWATDHQIAISSASPTTDPLGYDTKTAYGATRARVLAETEPAKALSNAENIAFFIESAKNEP